MDNRETCRIDIFFLITAALFFLFACGLVPPSQGAVEPVIIT